VVLSGVVWCGVVWCGVVWCGVVPLRKGYCAWCWKRRVTQHNPQLPTTSTTSHNTTICNFTTQPQNTQKYAKTILNIYIIG
jgi:hypothetical protein